MNPRAPTAGRRSSPLAPLLIAAGLLLAVGLLRVFVIESFKTPAGSMIPTLQPGDHFFVYKLSYLVGAPARGDVVVFPYPKEPRRDYVKRVIAVGGDTVEIRDGDVVLNGRPIDRPVDGDCRYTEVSEVTGTAVEHACRWVEETLDGRAIRVIRDKQYQGRSFPPVTVPPGQLYVLGDNRDNSMDSRYWGTLPAASVRGRARVR